MEKTLLATVEIDGVPTDVFIKCEAVTDEERLARNPKDCYYVEHLVRPRDGSRITHSATCYREEPITSTEGMGVKVTKSWNLDIGGPRDVRLERWTVHTEPA